ncbi:hypothetical protein ACI2UY_22565 [Ralstonia nicotianae]
MLDARFSADRQIRCDGLSDLEWQRIREPVSISQDAHACGEPSPMHAN